MNGADEEYRRLRWQCRRGLLELDLTFQGFLDQKYLSLNDSERDAFKRLLLLPDNTLLDYLNERESPDDPLLKKILMKMGVYPQDVCTQPPK